MEHRPAVCETFVQVDPTDATAGVHLAPCERPFHASCARDKLLVADDVDVTRSKNRSAAVDEVIPLSPSAYSCAQSIEEHPLSSAADVDDDLFFEDLTGYVEIIEQLISSLLRRITILPFVFKNKMTFVKIAMVF